MKKQKWDIRWEDQYPDIACNIAGVISDHKNYLFFHIYKVNDGDQTETMFVYDSIFSMYIPEGEPLCSFPWTSENEDILLGCLNSRKEFNGETLDAIKKLAFN